jgi:hypothetical protein
MTHLANDHIGDRESCGTSVPPLNKAAWLEALAALEAEFVAFQNQRLSPIGSSITGVAAGTQVTAHRRVGTGE